MFEEYFKEAYEGFFDEDDVRKRFNEFVEFTNEDLLEKSEEPTWDFFNKKLKKTCINSYLNKINLNNVTKTVFSAYTFK